MPDDRTHSKRKSPPPPLEFGLLKRPSRGWPMLTEQDPAKRIDSSSLIDPHSHFDRQNKPADVHPNASSTDAMNPLAVYDHSHLPLSTLNTSSSTLTGIAGIPLPYLYHPPSSSCSSSCSSSAAAAASMTSLPCLLTPSSSTTHSSKSTLAATSSSQTSRSSLKQQHPHARQGKGGKSYTFKSDRETCAHYFMASHCPQALTPLEALELSLKVRQQPLRGRLLSAQIAEGSKDKDRPPLDPLPIVQLLIKGVAFDVIPFLVVQVEAFPFSDSTITPNAQPLSKNKSTLSEAVLTESRRGAGSKIAFPLLMGSTVVAPNEVVDEDGSKQWLFLFPDLKITQEGTFRLKFTLLMLRQPHQPALISSNVLETSTNSAVAECWTDPFQNYDQRTYPGSLPSTSLARHLAQQGLKIPLRKDARYLPKSQQDLGAG